MSKLQNKYKNLNEADAKSEFYKAGVKAFNKGLYQRDNPYTDPTEKKEWDEGWVFTMQKTATSSGNKKKLNESEDKLELVDTDENYFKVSDRKLFIEELKRSIKAKNPSDNPHEQLLYSFSYKNPVASIGKIAGMDIWGRFIKEKNSTDDTQQKSYLKRLLSTAVSELVSEGFLFKIKHDDIDKIGLNKNHFYEKYSSYTNAEGKKMIDDYNKKHNISESNDYPKDKPLTEEEAEKAWNNASVQQREKLLYEYNNGKDFVEEWKNCEWEDDLHHSIKTIVKTGYKTESLFENNSSFEPKKFASDNDIDGYDLATIVEKSKNMGGIEIYDFSVNLIGKEKSDLLMPYLGVKLDESFERGSYKGKFKFISGLDDQQIRELCSQSKTENESPNRSLRDKSRFEGEIEVFANTGDFGTNFYNNFSDEQRQDLLNCIESYAKQNDLNESSNSPKNGDRIKITQGEYKDKEAFIEFVDDKDFVRKFVVNIIPDGKSITLESGQFVNMEDSENLFENKETLTKGDLARVLTLNAVNGRNFSDSDISDDILSKFNKKWSSIYKTNPSFDPFGLDVEVEEADVFDDFMDLIVSLGKSDSKVSLFENRKDFEIKRMRKLTQLFEEGVSKLGSSTNIVGLNENIKNIKGKIKDVERLTGEKFFGKI
jgi:hypothetical protein